MSKTNYSRLRKIENCFNQKKNIMKTQRIAIMVTMINLVLMIFLLAQLRPVTAQQQQNPSQVLRGRGLEIIDSLGKVRASISILPPVTVNGKLYPQTVLLRLIDSHGGPLVKLGAAEDGGGLNLDDGSDGGVQMIANNDGSFVRIKNQNGKEQVIKP
jgi:hypothetical protein